VSGSEAWEERLIVELLNSTARARLRIAMVRRAVGAMLLVNVLGTTSAWAGPKADLERSNQKINALLRRKAPQGSREAERIQAELKAEVNRFLDFEELGRRALARHWKERTEKERKEFVELLKDLIEHNYLKQLRQNLKFKVEYQAETVTGDTAEVRTLLHIRQNNRPKEFPIDYRMKMTGERWMVYDVISDEVSIVENYRSQFNRIIRRESFAKLLDRMRTRIETLDQAKPAQGAAEDDV
jgi:phospholipid transport system substrate-binding protein